MSVEQWCILRTAGRSTLPLVESLSAEGLSAWSPSFRRQKSGAKRKIDIPITPTYLFAGACHVPDLLAIAASPVSRHAGFSFLRHQGTIPSIVDSELDPLREEAENEARLERAIAEAERRKHEKPPVFLRDDRVTVLDRNFGSTVGVVEETEGKFVVVLFPYSLPMKISAFLVQPVSKAA